MISKRKRIYFTILFFLYVSSSCNYNNESPKNILTVKSIVGVYFKNTPKGVLDFVILKPDRSFLQYYQDSNFFYQNIGEWALANSKNNSISLVGWKSLPDTMISGYLVKYVNGELVFDYDNKDANNFFKKE